MWNLLNRCINGLSAKIPGTYSNYDTKKEILLYRAFSIREESIFTNYVSKSDKKCHFLKSCPGD